MIKQKTVVKVNPQIIKWIRSSGGWEINELAKKLNIDADTIRKWESKEQSIEIKKLEQLADCVKRPLAVFFLKNPPIESELTDFRKLSGSETGALCKKTLVSIRETKYLQSIAAELLKNQKLSLEPEIMLFTLADDPEKIAIVERIKLGFESESKLLSKHSLKSINNFYSTLRKIIESFNIFIFQASMPVKEARGFTISNTFPRVIVVNSSDTYQARIFTLLHEYGHLLLKKDGICLAEPVLLKTKRSIDQIQKIERWCNIFAASVLMPRQDFLAQLRSLENHYNDYTKIIAYLSSHFKTSKKATIVRILNISPTTSLPNYEYYEKMYYAPEKKPKKKKSSGGPNAIDIVISRKGRKFVSLVVNSKEKKIVNTSDVISYLRINQKYVDKLQEKL